MHFGGKFFFLFLEKNFEKKNYFAFVFKSPLFVEGSPYNVSPLFFFSLNRFLSRLNLFLPVKIFFKNQIEFKFETILTNLKIQAM